jgi:hypothetical protein
MITDRTLLTLRRKGWTFHMVWGDGFQGRCVWGKKTLEVNVWMVLASVIIHEAIHATNPSFPEEIVLALENIERGKLTRKRAEGIVRVFSPELYHFLKGDK